MKRILMVILVFGGLAMAANYQFNTSDVNLSWNNLTEGDCVIFTDLNDTFCFPIYKANLTIQMNYSQIIADTVHNITYIAPSFPSINQNITLPAGAYYTAPDYRYNLTIYCQYQQQSCAVNSIVDLTYSQNYTFPSVNATCRAPPFPKIKQNITLSSGQNITFNEYELTVIAPNCKRGIRKNLTLNEIFYDDYSDIGINAPADTSCFENIIKNLTLGENYYSRKSNSTYSCPPKLNLNKTLAYNETYTDSFYGVFIKAPEEKICPIPPDKCTFYYNDSIENCSSPLITVPIDETYNTSNNTITVCTDSLAYFCSPTEIMSGRVGSCFRRYTNSLLSTKDKLANDLDVCRNTLKSYNAGAELAEKNLNFWKGIFMIIIVSLIGIAGIAYWLRSKRLMEEQPPLRGGD